MSPSAVISQRAGSSVSAARRRGASTGAPPVAVRNSRARSSLHNKRVPGSRKIVGSLLPAFSRQFSGMLTAGMSVVTSLQTLEEQAGNPHFGKVLGQVRKSIEGGLSLSEALVVFPSIFDELYTNMVKGGEKGGKLPETIGRLASFLEATAKLKRKVKSAMMYPAIVVCLAIAIAIGMIVFIVPVFGKMYADFGASLPGPTQFLMNVGEGMKKYGLFVLGGAIAGFIAFKKWKATPQGGYKFDQFILRMPVFGALNQKVISARFARTFGQLTRSGVPILEGLDIAAGATGNKVAARVVLMGRDAVEKGEPLSAAMMNQKVFPLMLVRMLQAGEKSGKVDEMLDNIADYYEDEVDTMLSGLTSLLEPLLIVFLGVIIGSIVVCMFLPIFKMSSIIKG
jgi:type IV pilus assembly protein PilC